MELFEANKALVVRDPAEVEKFRKALFNEEGVISKHVVGQSVQKIGALAEVAIPEDIKIVVLEASGLKKDVLAKERCVPASAHSGMTSLKTP